MSDLGVMQTLADYARRMHQEAPVLDTAEQYDLVRRAQAGDAQARDKLVVGNLRLIVRVARAFLDGPNAADVCQAGVEGLMVAVERFDVNRRHRFSTYAENWIRERVQRYVASHEYDAVRLPMPVFDEMGTIRSVERHLFSRLGREPTNGEVAAKAAMPEARVALLRSLSRSKLSLDAPIRMPDGVVELGATMSDIIAGPESVERQVADDDERAWLRGRLGCLSADEQRCIEYRFGLNDEPLDLLATSRRIGVSRLDARRLERSALAKLRAATGEPASAEAVVA